MIADPLSILITDDDRRFRETVREVIAPQGFRTLLAGDGQEALEILQRDEVHLLLLDMHMPRLSGLETIERVKRLNSQLPCILMSAEADEQLVQRALEAQAFAVLRKPVSRDTIICNVRQALRRAYDWRERHSQ
ncbi:MAG TPA: response regulator [Pirellulales bacterium]|jgi:CheY-like chemotaxis protein|nr:response regulator [Pirellulales bacterium]